MSNCFKSHNYIINYYFILLQFPQANMMQLNDMLLQIRDKAIEQ